MAFENLRIIVFQSSAYTWIWNFPVYDGEVWRSWVSRIQGNMIVHGRVWKEGSVLFICLFHLPDSGESLLVE